MSITFMLLAVSRTPVAAQSPLRFALTDTSAEFAPHCGVNGTIATLHVRVK